MTGLITLFVATFVGNSGFAGLPLQLIVMPVLLLLAPVYLHWMRQHPGYPAGASYKHCERVLVLALIFLIPVSLILVLDSGRSYDSYFFLFPYEVTFWTLILICYLVCVPSTQLSNVGNWALVLCAVFIGLCHTNSADGRAYFIWGPNMSYRVVVVLAWLAILEARRPLFALVALILMIHGVALIGSRGGVIASLLPVLSTVYRFPKASFIFFVVAIASITAGSVSLEYRITNFEISYGVVPRLDFLIALPDNITALGNSHSQFLTENTYEQFVYPHNLFGELIYFYGYVGIVISVVVWVGVVRAIYCLFLWKRQLRLIENWFIVCFLVAFCGSMFSGDLRDNSYVVAAAILLICGYPATQIYARNLTRNTELGKLRTDHSLGG